MVRRRPAGLSRGRRVATVTEPHAGPLPLGRRAGPALGPAGGMAVGWSTGPSGARRAALPLLALALGLVVQGWGAAPGPPVPTLVPFAAAYIAAWNAHDLPAVLASFAPDAVVRYRGAGVSEARWAPRAWRRPRRTGGTARTRAASTRSPGPRGSGRSWRRSSRGICASRPRTTARPPTGRPGPTGSARIRIGGCPGSSPSRAAPRSSCGPARSPTCASRPIPPPSPGTTPPSWPPWSRGRSRARPDRRPAAPAGAVPGGGCGDADSRGDRRSMAAAARRPRRRGRPAGAARRTPRG